MLIVLMFPTICYGANYATCVLDKMPGLQNDSAAMAAGKLCIDKYPSGWSGVPNGSGRGWLSYSSGAECAADKAAKTQSPLAGRMIFGACIKLYDAPINADPP